jgi:hypothetical protein
VPNLSSYSSNAPKSFWDSFPKNDLPEKIETKLNTEVSEGNIEKAKNNMLPHQFAKAQKALSFLRYGVPAYQKISLPGCKMEITPSSAEYGVDIADMIASWVKKKGSSAIPSVNPR